jgi:curved DNA-binding protein CbpA
MEPDYYNTLGLAKSASPNEIKAAYRQLAMQWHPDRHPPSGKSEAHRRFIQIGQAREILSNPSTRQEFDRSQADYHDQQGARSGSYSPPAEPSAEYQQAKSEAARRDEEFAKDLEAFIHWLEGAASTVVNHIRDNKDEYKKGAGITAGAIIGAVALGAIFPPAAFLGYKMGMHFGEKATSPPKKTPAWKSSPSPPPRNQNQCPSCGFKFGWNGSRCSHCRYAS